MFCRPIVCLAHPGHELRIWGWVQKYKPIVHVLTDGSGHSSMPRIRETRLLLDRLDARSGEIFGDLTDRQMYDAILGQRFPVFTALLDRLVASIISRDADAIIVDPYEGFNPSHDICHVLANTAARIASHRSGQAIRSYDFELCEIECGTNGGPEFSNLILSDVLQAEKIKAARSYRGLEMETAQAIAKHGIEHFQNEALRQIPDLAPPPVLPALYYESVGKERVQDGIYAARIEFQKHVEPILAHIRAQAQNLGA